MGILSSLVIALSGTLPHAARQIKKQIETHDGRVSASTRDPTMTHLIVSKDVWRAIARADREAAERERDVWIVSYDWLEDSLYCKRRLSEHKYTWKHQWQERRRRKELKRLGPVNDGENFKNGCREAKALIGTDLYHYYQDATGFEYKIKLTRSDFSSNNFAQYGIGLLESHAKPHAYCTVIQYSPPVHRNSDFDSVGCNVSSAEARHHLLQFLQDGKADGMEQQQQQQSSVAIHANSIKQAMGHKSEASYLQVALPSTQPVHMNSDQVDDQAGEGTRLASLIKPAAPYEDACYTALICPMNSRFLDAWRAFRHAFRDITLLSWEERFQCSTAVQKYRAEHLEIEPFIYVKPKDGLPIGLLPQQAGLFHGTAGGLEIMGEADDGYFRNAFDLPSISKALSKNGAIGSALYLEKEERERKEEEERHEARNRAEDRQGAVIQKKSGKKVNFSKPFFIGTTGTPLTDGCERYTVTKDFCSAITYGSLVRATKRRNPFPSERCD